MFERFTEKAIKVIILSQEEARRQGHNFVGTEQLLLEEARQLGHNYIGTEHLLLSLSRAADKSALFKGWRVPQ